MLWQPHFLRRGRKAGNSEIDYSPPLYDAVTPIPLVSSGLIHWIESTDFDGQGNGSAISSWKDKTPYGNNWTNLGCTVDTSTTANGHATVRFDGSSFAMTQPPFLPAAATAFTGMEVFCCYKRDADPPVAGVTQGAAFMFNHGQLTFPAHQPWLDGHFYECFGRADRPDIGDPATSTATTFIVYNVSVAANGTSYNAWINTENFFTASSGYTFITAGFDIQGRSGYTQVYTLGRSDFYGSTTYYLAGNIAGLYLYNRQLTTSERNQVRTYIKNVFGAG